MITCTAIRKLMQRGRIGLGLPLHVCGDISETDVCFTERERVFICHSGSRPEGAMPINAGDQIIVTDTLYMLHR